MWISNSFPRKTGTSPKFAHVSKFFFDFYNFLGKKKKNDSLRKFLLADRNKLEKLAAWFRQAKRGFFVQSFSHIGKKETKREKN